MDKEEILGFTNKLYKLTLLFPKKEPLRYKMREVGLDLLADIVLWSREDFSNSSRKLISDIGRKLEVLTSFFQLAKEQNWAKKEDISGIEEEYEKTKEEIKTILSRPRKIEETFKPAPASPAPASVSAPTPTPTPTPAPTSASASALANEKQREKWGRAQPAGEGPGISEKEVGEKPVVSLPPTGLGSQKTDVILDKRQKGVLKILQEKREIQIGQLSKKFPQVSRRTLLRDLEKLSQMGFVAREGTGRGVFYRFRLKKA